MITFRTWTASSAQDWRSIPSWRGLMSELDLSTFSEVVLHGAMFTFLTR